MFAADAYVPFPAWDALIVACPAATMDTTPPDVTVATEVFRLVKVTGKLELDVALMLKLESPGSLFGILPKLIVCDLLPRIFILKTWFEAEEKCESPACFKVTRTTPTRLGLSNPAESTERTELLLVSYVMGSPEDA